MGNTNTLAINRNCIYKCANDLLTKIKFEYNEEANLVRDLNNNTISPQNKLVKYPEYDLNKYGLNHKLKILYR